MDSSDYFSENCVKDLASEVSKQTYQKIESLWLEFARFEISLQQYKTAVEVFEKALKDPIISIRSTVVSDNLVRDGGSFNIYTAYADFCIDRGKLANAQKVFIRALCAGLREPENAQLWTKFSNLMKRIDTSQKQQNMSLQELYEAVKTSTHCDIEKLAKPSPATLHPTEVPDIVENTPTKSTASIVINQSEEKADASKQAIDSLDLVTGITPELLIRTFSVRPPMLFTVPLKVRILNLP